MIKFTGLLAPNPRARDVEPAVLIHDAPPLVRVGDGPGNARHTLRPHPARSDGSPRDARRPKAPAVSSAGIVASSREICMMCEGINGR